MSKYRTSNAIQCEQYTTVQHGNINIGCYYPNVDVVKAHFLEKPCHIPHFICRGAYTARYTQNETDSSLINNNYRTKLYCTSTV